MLNNSTYYYHSSLSALSQNDLYAILWNGGIASGILFVLAPVVITIVMIGKIDQHRGDSVIGLFVGKMAEVLFWSLMWYMFILIFYTLYIYGVGKNGGMSTAEAMEWFYHTDWIHNLKTLTENLDAIKAYGADAEEIGKNTVITIYLIRVAITLLMIGFAVLIFFTMLLKLSKIINQQSVNSVEQSGAFFFVGVLSSIVLVLTIGMMDLVFDEIFRMSDMFAETQTVNTPIKIEYVYLDIFDPKLYGILQPTTEVDYLSETTDSGL